MAGLRRVAATVPAPLADVLVKAFVARTAPGGGLASLSSMNHAHQALVRFDRYLARLLRPRRAGPERGDLIVGGLADGDVAHDPPPGLRHPGSAEAEREEPRFAVRHALNWVSVRL